MTVRIKFTRSLQRLGLFAALAAAVVWVTASCAQEDRPAKEFRVGLVAPLRGAWSALDQGLLVEAARMAEDEANRPGGLSLGGRLLKVRLIIEDNLNQVDFSVNAARQLINQERVSALVGPFISANAIPVSFVAEKARVPMLSPTATNPEVFRGKEYVFAVSPSDVFQGSAMADFAAKDLGARSAAVIYDRSDPYSRDLARFFRQAFERHGRISAFEPYVGGEKDFAASLKRVKAQGTDVLFLPNYPDDLLIQMRQARRIGAARHYLGGDSWFVYPLMGSPDLDGGYFSTMYFPDNPGPENTRFRERFEKRCGKPPDSDAALTYDAFSLLFTAAKRAGSDYPELIRRALAETRDFRGVTGSLSFGPKGLEKRSMFILRIQKARPMLVKETDPDGEKDNG
ncbi:MAG: ABC transporter substrate-binding protein [Desulfovibrionaceae bacterium]|nr:ABC transporter substrate-binding protein [Desulfovibrionaceae bacterium]